MEKGVRELQAPEFFGTPQLRNNKTNWKSVECKQPKNNMK